MNIQRVKPKKSLGYRITIREDDLDEACILICESKKSMNIFSLAVVQLSLLRGRTCSFVELTGCTGMRFHDGKRCAYDEEKIMYTGMLGMHGDKNINFGVSKCDLLVV